MLNRQRAAIENHRPRIRNGMHAFSGHIKNIHAMNIPQWVLITWKQQHQQQISKHISNFHLHRLSRWHLFVRYWPRRRRPTAVMQKDSPTHNFLVCPMISSRNTFHWIIHKSFLPLRIRKEQSNIVTVIKIELFDYLLLFAVLLLIAHYLKQWTLI